MMLSIYAGLSGLNSQQTKLDVIGNNVANVSTVAYKGQRVLFSDLLSQTIANASGANEASNRGGTNPQQVGLGVSVGSIDTNMTEGSTQTTGSTTDLSIAGSGYLIVQGEGSGNYYFTRAGNFGVDVEGNLVVNGRNICGWLEYEALDDGSYEYDTQQGVETINLFTDQYNGNKLVIAPEATTTATLTGSLNSEAETQGTGLTNIGTDYTPDASTTMTVYDALGNGYDVTVELTKCYIDNTTDPNNPITTWYWEVDSTSSDISVSGNGYLAFDKNGDIVTTDTTYDTNPQLTFTPQGSNGGTTAFTVDLDFTNLTSYSSSTSTLSADVDGYESGELQDISIDSSGVINGVYSNGETQPLGMIALATFDNSAGLKKEGSNFYSTTVNSGDFEGGVVAGTEGTGTLTSGTLEMSNVDLAEELSEMMIAQRAYQANSKVISTADEMLQAIINMVS